MDEFDNIQGETAVWSEGDWNGDGVFGSGDFVTAFVDGGYELGPRTDVVLVPEPAGTLLLVIGVPLGLIGRRTRRVSRTASADDFPKRVPLGGLHGLNFLTCTPPE